MAPGDPTRAGGSCPNCGARRVGPYCHRCGQKRLAPEERTLRHFLGQFINALLHLDGRFPRTLGLLLARPGALGRRYLAGQRRRYVAPLALFLIGNVVFFFSPPLTDLVLPLHDHLNYQVYSSPARYLVEERLDSRGLTMSEYAGTFEARQTGIAKLLVVIHWPVVAWGLMALHRRKALFYVDHLALALYLGAFMMILYTLVPYLFLLGAYLTLPLADDPAALRQRLSLAMKWALLGGTVVWSACLLRGASLSRATSWCTARPIFFWSIFSPERGIPRLAWESAMR